LPTPRRHASVITAAHSGFFFTLKEKPMHFIHKVIGLGVLTTSVAVNAQAAFIALPMDGAHAGLAMQKTGAAETAFAELSDNRSVFKLALADGRPPTSANRFENQVPSVQATDPTMGVVPEPSTYATLLAGLAVLTLVMNRRRD
jgi:hypothetical protein